MTASLDNLVKVLNRNLKYGWGITDVNQGTDYIFPGEYGEPHRISRITLSSMADRSERIDLFHAARSENLLGGVLAFDWSVERKDNTICLYRDCGYLILAAQDLPDHWPEWKVDLRNAFQTFTRKDTSA